jgi:molybdate transport system substrate-binding protein
VTRPLAATCCLLLAACSAFAAQRPATLTIFAAASLADALEEAAAQYQAAVPGIRLTISTASSGALWTQIAAGAHADLFLSADSSNPAAMAAAGLADGSPLTFAANRLTIVVPIDNPARIASPADLARSGVRIVAAARGAPIATYTDSLLANLAGLAGYPPEYAAQFDRNVVSRADDARAIVSTVEVGEADAGIAYVTDAASASGVAIVPIPAAAEVTASYVGVVVRGTDQPAAARAFLRWLAGPRGQAILSSFGFLPP